MKVQSLTPSGEETLGLDETSCSPAGTGDLGTEEDALKTAEDDQ